ncbi:MAG TPA: prolyl oligopeptidase family serine peptidase, partial [Chloroflexota bacterium]|nr:prolyl oligopeptidase family serine peptidase [Chloroflexota bacterium]
CSTLERPALIPWRKVADVEDAVTGFDIKGETIFLKSHRDAPRFKVLATAAATPDLASAVTVVPESTVVIQDLRVAGDYLLTRDLDGGIGRLRRTPLAGGTPQPVALPFEGTVRELAGAPAAPQVLLQLTSWTESPRIFRCDVQEATVEDTGWLPPSPIDFGDIEAHEVQAPAPDGTLVPLSIVHRKGLPRDGSSPTLLMGYGSYGFTLDPAFVPAMLAWYERGGVYAIAHLRGGGEYGDDWHRAGQKLNKEHTITDLIACAEYLIAHGYTCPERLAGEGTSAGGIPSGGALVRRPDLWAVMVIRVGVTNTLRVETSENGPNNVPEFGSVSTEEGFRGLLITDSYSRVRKGLAYPAVLLTTGLNDPRVVVWQASKMAARLQAATSSGKPILLRVEEQAGHGMGSTRRQIDEELADTLAFLLDQFA